MFELSPKDCHRQRTEKRNRELEGQRLDVATATVERMPYRTDQLADRDRSVTVGISVATAFERPSTQGEIDHRHQLGDPNGLVVVAVTGATRHPGMRRVRARVETNDQRGREQRNTKANSPAVPRHDRSVTKQKLFGQILLCNGQL